MSLISLVIALLIIGLILYLIQLAPIDAKIKNIIYVVVVIFVIIYLLQSLAITGTPVLTIR